jgi:hypothetical protein
MPRIRNTLSGTEEVEHELRLQGVAFEALSHEERDRLRAQWLRSFAVRETPVAEHYVFAFGLQEKAAKEAYRAAWTRKLEGAWRRGFYFVVKTAGWEEAPAYRCRSATPLEYSMLDCWVCPLDWEWTMVFTHEGDEYGPFFTMRDWRSHPPRGREPLGPKPKKGKR